MHWFAVPGLFAIRWAFFGYRYDVSAVAVGIELLTPVPEIQWAQGRMTYEVISGGFFLIPDESIRRFGFVRAIWKSLKYYAQENLCLQN